jgi:putative flippase GtrA
MAIKKTSLHSTKFPRFLKFWLTGISGTIIDTAVLFILSRYVFQTTFLIYFIAPTISFEFAMFNNFNLSYYWVWKDRKGTSSYFTKLLKYNLTCIVAFGVKMPILILTMQLFHLDVILCNLVGLCFSFLVNYFGGDKFVFRKKLIGG